MKGPPPPIRFLALAVGGWIGIRAALLLPGEAQPSAGPSSARAAPLALALPATTHRGHPLAFRPGRRPAPVLVTHPSSFAAPETAWHVRLALPATAAAAEMRAPAASPLIPMIEPLPHLPPRDRRWTASAWLLLREGDPAALATGGMLGGSQAGGRLGWRLNGDPRRPLSLSLRLYAPLDQPDAAEMALGAEWQPLATVPVRILAERRQAVGSAGRSAFSFLAHGGVSDTPVAGPLRLDAYAQAGIVGLKSRDLFVDGSAELSLPLDGKGRVRIGGGLWGAAQPGVARLDLGPQATFRLPVSGGGARVSAGWRFRVAGDAAPASGPALTVAAGF